MLSAQIDVAECVNVLREKRDVLLAGGLHDLKRVGDPFEARHAGDIALVHGIGGVVLRIGFFAGEGFGLVGNAAVGRIDDDVFAGDFSFEIGVDFGADFPDAVEIGFAVFEARDLGCGCQGDSQGYRKEKQGRTHGCAPRVCGSRRSRRAGCVHRAFLLCGHLR